MQRGRATLCATRDRVEPLAREERSARPPRVGEGGVITRPGARFRNDIVSGFGGKQILLDDPAGNPIELFEAPRK